MIPLLAGSSTVEVVAAARNRAKAAKLGVSAVHLDLDDFATIAPALIGIDRIFMATGYTVDMLRQSKDLVNCAVRAGVKQIVHLGARAEMMTRALLITAGISSSSVTLPLPGSALPIFVQRSSCRTSSDTAARAT